MYVTCLWADIFMSRTVKKYFKTKYAHVLNVRAFRIEWEFRSVGFWGEGQTGVPGEKPLRAEKRTNNKLNPHTTPRERGEGETGVPGEKPLGAEKRTNNKLNPHMTPRERGEGETGVPGEKPLGAEKRTNNKLNPHMTSSPGIEPGPHWWSSPNTFLKCLLRDAAKTGKVSLLLNLSFLWRHLKTKNRKNKKDNWSSVKRTHLETHPKVLRSQSREVKQEGRYSFYYREISLFARWTKPDSSSRSVIAQ